MDGSLSERQKKEESYHDNIYKKNAESKVSRIGDTEYYDFFWNAVGDVNGKMFLTSVAVMAGLVSNMLKTVHMYGGLISPANSLRRQRSGS